MLACAEQIHQSFPTTEVIFRAGVWKPRTAPESYQGAGAEALAWLREVRDTYGYAIATEVATPEQAAIALKAGLRHLWIGARTSANPIAVQAIADALRGADPALMVFVKNPVNEDSALWLGNIRRLQAVASVAAIHRGCGHRPCWQMAWDVRQAMPELPLLLDPSHMAGCRDGIAPLVERASVLAFDGLMVELHPDPAHALSDAAQQLTPAEFAKVYSSTVGANSSAAGTISGAPVALTWLRSIMDETDDRLWAVIAERMAVSRRIGEWKHAHHTEVVQPSRWEEVVNRRLQWAETIGLPEDTVRTILDALHTESCRQQQ